MLLEKLRLGAETILLSYFIADFDVMPSGRMVLESFCFLNPVETTCMWK